MNEGSARAPSSSDVAIELNELITFNAMTNVQQHSVSHHARLWWMAAGGCIVASFIIQAKDVKNVLHDISVLLASLFAVGTAYMFLLLLCSAWRMKVSRTSEPFLRVDERGVCFVERTGAVSVQSWSGVTRVCITDEAIAITCRSQRTAVRGFAQLTSSQRRRLRRILAQYVQTETQLHGLQSLGPKPTDDT
jgi:hypothetical protein